MHLNKKHFSLNFWNNFTHRYLGVQISCGYYRWRWIPSVVTISLNFWWRTLDIEVRFPAPTGYEHGYDW